MKRLMLLTLAVLTLASAASHIQVKDMPVPPCYPSCPAF
jgi:hypothetical protein